MRPQANSRESLAKKTGAVRMRDWTELHGQGGWVQSNVRAGRKVTLFRNGQRNGSEHSHESL